MPRMANKGNTMHNESKIKETILEGDNEFHLEDNDEMSLTGAAIFYIATAIFMVTSSLVIVYINIKGA